MKLTNAELLRTKDPLIQLGKVKLPVKVSLDLVHMTRKLDEFLIPLEQVKDGLIRQYGEAPKDDPAKLHIEPGMKNWEKFMTEYAELMAQEIEVVIQPLMLPPDVEIEPMVIAALEKFIGIAS